jgi:hypothetical protein
VAPDLISSILWKTFKTSRGLRGFSSNFEARNIDAIAMIYIFTKERVNFCIFSLGNESL